MCPSASNWGHWDLGEATEQTDCLRPVAGEIHLVLGCVCILTSGLPFYSTREGSRMRLLVLSVFVWVLWVSVCDMCGWPSMFIYTYRHLYVCSVYVCVPAGNISLASLLVGHWVAAALEAVGSGMIYFLLTLSWAVCLYWCNYSKFSIIYFWCFTENVEIFLTSTCLLLPSLISFFKLGFSPKYLDSSSNLTEAVLLKSSCWEISKYCIIKRNY